MKLSLVLEGSISAEAAVGWLERGFLLVFEGLLSVIGNERFMLEDTVTAIEALNQFSIRILPLPKSAASGGVSCSSDQHRTEASGFETFSTTTSTTQQQQQADVGMRGREVLLYLPEEALRALPREFACPGKRNPLSLSYEQFLALRQRHLFRDTHSSHSISGHLSMIHQPCCMNTVISTLTYRPPPVPGPGRVFLQRHRHPSPGEHQQEPQQRYALQSGVVRVTLLVDQSSGGGCGRGGFCGERWHGQSGGVSCHAVPPAWYQRASAGAVVGLLSTTQRRRRRSVIPHATIYITPPRLPHATHNHRTTYNTAPNHHHPSYIPL